MADEQHHDLKQIKIGNDIFDIKSGGMSAIVNNENLRLENDSNSNSITGYLPLTGGTLTGNLTINIDGGSGVGGSRLIFSNNNATKDLAWIGQAIAAPYYQGMYSHGYYKSTEDKEGNITYSWKDSNKWIFYRNDKGENIFNGDANTATQLKTAQKIFVHLGREHDDFELKNHPVSKFDGTTTSFGASEGTRIGVSSYLPIHHGGTGAGYSGSIEKNTEGEITNTDYNIEKIKSEARDNLDTSYAISFTVSDINNDKVINKKDIKWSIIKEKLRYLTIGRTATIYVHQNYAFKLTNGKLGIQIEEDGTETGGDLDQAGVYYGLVNRDAEENYHFTLIRTSPTDAPSAIYCFTLSEKYLQINTSNNPSSDVQIAVTKIPLTT